MDTAEIDDQVNVIEIGPDIGALTEFLTERAAEVMAFEIDYRLVPILADTLRDFDNVIVVNEDILKVDLAAEMGVTRMNIVGFDKKIERAPRIGRWIWATLRNYWLASDWSRDVHRRGRSILAWKVKTSQGLLPWGRLDWLSLDDSI